MEITKPIRIQRSRKHKNVSPNDLPVVYVGRPSKWGNPFKVSKYRTRKKAVDLFRAMIVTGEIDVNEIRDELKGKNLSCWCKVGDSCHADVLLEIANQ